MQTKILFYNVENLFDTLDDPLTNDNSFLPNSELKWEQKRYVVKLQRISRVLKETEEPMPGIIGLAEVENRKVLLDLIFSVGLSENEVGIAHFDSPDERGIDVALLYRKDLFRIADQESITPISVTFDEDYSDKTRDILYVPLQNKSKDVLHVYVNHWPSRREGKEISMKKRFSAAKAMRQHIDIVLTKDPDARIIAMGDLNCTPDSPPVYKILDQKGNPENPLINLSWDIHRSGKGSTNFKGKWLIFDQILVSPNLTSDFQNQELYKSESNRFTVSPLSVVSYPWLLFYNPKYNDHRPHKTFGGRKYHGGYSDHLPVAVELKFND
jgi:predicted extracellular nuclease